MFAGLRKGGKRTIVTGHKVVSQTQAQGGLALGVALKTIYPINTGASEGNSWHFVGITYGGEKRGLGRVSVWSTPHQKRKALQSVHESKKLAVA